MSCFLALECSMAEGSLAVLEFDKENLKCLAEEKWTHRFDGKRLQNSHSDKLPIEIQRTITKAGKKLSDLDFLAVGTGPGRWTGVRTAINVIRTLSFCFDLPIYSVNSLRVCAESFLSQSQPVFVAINGFKNQVYFAEFYSKEDREGKLSLLSFPDWCEYIEKKAKTLEGKKIICISDLKDFYSLPQNLENICSFEKINPSALNLAQIVFKQKEIKTHQTWSQLQACYLRSPV